MEFGTDDLLTDEDPTIEIVASYHFGKTKSREKHQDPEDDKEKSRQLEEEIERQRKEKEQRELQARREMEREKDSLSEIQRKNVQLELQRKKDSISRLQNQTVEVKPNERYEEVESEDGLQAGFYLIANVYGTKKYFESFMETVREMGLEPKSFYRKSNRYNYVYLERYNTMEEARKARDSKFYGKYVYKTWIFRVRGN